MFFSGKRGSAHLNAHDCKEYNAEDILVICITTKSSVYIWPGAWAG